jgi:hypothetical protein
MKWYILPVLAALPFMAAAQFTPHNRLTASDSISYTPYNNSHGMAVHDQSVHIAWTDRRDGAGEVYYKRSLDGGITWGNDIRITPDDDVFSGRATIALWKNEIHIVWMDRRDGNNELYYTRSTNNGNTWSDEVRLTDDAANSEYPSLAVDFQSLHLVWNDTRHGASEIYYKRSTNGGLSWSDDIRFTNHAGDSYKPSVAVVDSLVHVAWEDIRNGTSEIFYNHSSDNGITWGTDEKLSNSLSNCFAPCISANGDIVFATWDDNRTVNSEIYGRRSIDSGNSWAPEVNLTNSSQESFGAYHTFSGTYMCMIYNENNNPTDPDIYGRFSTDAGASWTSTGAISVNFSRSENAFIAVSGQTVHAVWRDDLFGNYEIFYARNPNGNPFKEQHALGFAQQIKSAQTDIIHSMTYDASGNALLIGSFSGTVDFDPGPGEFNLHSAGSTDVFVYKLDRTGALVWATSIGGQQTDTGYDIALDAEGNIIITGSFHDIVDFDPGPEDFKMGSLGQEDIFIVKLNAIGNFTWARRIGGTGRDEPQSIVVNTNGGIILTGYYSEYADFDPGPNSALQQSFGEEDIFIAAYNALGDYMWAKSIGGTGVDMARSIDLSSANELTITGSFRNTVDFNPGAGDSILTSMGENDIFILRFHADGEFGWVRRIGGIESDEGAMITTDLAGNIYSTGHFSNGVNFLGTPVPSFSETDMYVLSQSPNGNLRWVQPYGGVGPSGGSDRGAAISIHDEYVYVAGLMTGTSDYQPGNSQILLHSSGNTDVVVQKLKSQNGQMQWLHQLGGSMKDVATSIAVIPHGKVAVAGYFLGIADFSPNIEQQRFVSAGEEDGFLSVILECEPSFASFEMTACGELVFDEQNTFTTSGTYTILKETAEGCDSVITVVATILTESQASVTASACDSYTTPSENHTWTESGVYRDTLDAINGCDSIVTYFLTIHQSHDAVIQTAACDSYIDPDGNAITVSGEYEYLYTTAGGCDSTITLILTIHQSAASDTTIQTCDAYTTPDGSITWPVSGKYTYNAHTVDGCDSIVTINLFITKWDTAITVIDGTLEAVNQFANFQWVDCANNYAPIFGENVSSFTPGESGSYAVIIGDAECLDTSACYTVIVVGQDEPGILRDAVVYPNPTRDYVYLTLPAGIGAVDISLTDLLGRPLSSTQIIDVTSSRLELNYPPGLYLLTVISGESRRTIRIVRM